MHVCDCFTILETRGGNEFPRCDVCDNLEKDHKNAGRRRLSGGAIEELRKRMIVELYERHEKSSQNGEDASPPR